MKTREELEALAEKIYDEIEHGNLHGAAMLLDDLHSEGMRDAAEMVRKSARLNANATEGNRVHDLLNYQAEIILAAIDNKQKHT